MSTNLSLSNYRSDNGSNSSSNKKNGKNNPAKRSNERKKRRLFHPFDPLKDGLGPVQASLGTDFPEPDI